MINEIWKDIEGYEGLYQISNKGRVKSLDRYIIDRGIKKFHKGRIMKLKYSERTGYISVKLYKNGKYKDLRVHRLVAQAFIPNPNNYPEVNHKDENKENNCVENLEWCNKTYNINYGNRNSSVSKKQKGKRNKGAIKQLKPVKCLTTGEVFDSLKSAAIKYNIKNPNQIANMIKGKHSYAGKLDDGTHLKWKFL